MINSQAFGTTDISRICLVSPQTVKRWIEEGKLPHFTTGGGHRRVWARDLVDFLRSHNMPVPPSLQGVRARRVLIVDDDVNVRRNAGRVLAATHPDVEIHEAADGFEAGQKIVDLAPSLILLDMRLPGIDGLKVCRSIRSRESLRKVKILAMSGYNVEEARKDAIAAGADDFLAKPFDIEELKTRLKALLPVFSRENSNGQNR